MTWAKGHELQGGKYIIRQVLGEGGFGITYLAHHRLLDCLVVIKTPNDKLQNDLNYVQFRQKFLREARVLAKLTQQRHPHIVAVQDLCDEEGLPCLVMEYVQGQTVLDMVQKHGALPEQEALAYVRQIGDALRLVHEQGLVHRDAHPGNIMLTAEGRAMLIDFGLAREVVPNASTQSLNVAFAPWEQMTGVVGPTIDVYTLAASLYFAVTGKVPTPCLQRKMMNKTLLTPQRHLPQLSSWLNEAILKGMALEPEQRPQTMAAFEQLLKSSAAATPPQKRSSNLSVLQRRESLASSVAYWPKPSQKGPLALDRFHFETVQVNNQGTIIERIQRKAEKFEEDLGNGLMLEMVKIPAGQFVMGSPEDEKGRGDSEDPQREVRVPEFFMGRFALTQVQYQALMGNNPSEFGGHKHPVECVSLNDALSYCEKLSMKSGKAYRLPSEAEWEYACRAGTTTPFHCGPIITPDLANYHHGSGYIHTRESEENLRKQTTEVGRFFPNAFGLHDMHGNVLEWCSDRWHYNYKGAPIDGSAWMDADFSELCVMRGGSWKRHGRNCRSACRHDAHPSNRASDFGFRVVFELPRA